MKINIKDYLIGMLGGIFVVIIVLSISFGAYNPLTIFAVNFGYSYASAVHSNDNFTTEIADYCAIFLNRGDDEKVVECVVGYVSPYYNYSNRNTTLFEKTIKSPSEFKEETSICRDVAVVYDIVFRKYEWVTSYVFDEGHVYNHVSTENISCTINGREWHCYG